MLCVYVCMRKRWGGSVMDQKFKNVSFSTVGQAVFKVLQICIYMQCGPMTNREQK